jgi:hypothetical protein
VAEWTNAIAAWASVALMLVNLVAMYLLSRSRASKEELAQRDKLHAELAQTVAGLDKRTAVMEEAIKHIPTQEDLSKLTSVVAAVKGSLDTFTLATDAMSRALDRVQQFLLNGGAK